MPVIILQSVSLNIETKIYYGIIIIIICLTNVNVPIFLGYCMALNLFIFQLSGQVTLFTDAQTNVVCPMTI